MVFPWTIKWTTPEKLVQYKMHFYTLVIHKNMQNQLLKKDNYPSASHPIHLISDQKPADNITKNAQKSV